MWKQAVQDEPPIVNSLTQVNTQATVTVKLALRSVGSEKAYGQVIGTVRPILRTYQQDPARQKV